MHCTANQTEINDTYCTMRLAADPQTGVWKLLFRRLFLKILSRLDHLETFLLHMSIFCVLECILFQVLTSLWQTFEMGAFTKSLHQHVRADQPRYAQFWILELSFRGREVYENSGLFTKHVWKLAMHIRWSEKNCLKNAADCVRGMVIWSAAPAENLVLQYFARQNRVTQEVQIMPRGSSIF